jgi:hypothetical protein
LTAAAQRGGAYSKKPIKCVRGQPSAAAKIGQPVKASSSLRFVPAGLPFAKSWDHV